MTQAPQAAIDAQARWLALAPDPKRPKPNGVQWDIFLSYRSVNRTWALALHDALLGAGFDVFLDQFVLPAGVEIDGFLRQNLKASASGVVVWSGDAATSDFVAAELHAMRKLAKDRPGFRYVLAKLDATELPFLEANDLYVDFSSYPEGPRGGELLKLMFGLTGSPLSAQAVYEINQLDDGTTSIVHSISAARAAGALEVLKKLAQEARPEFFVTSLPYSVLVEALIQLGENELALVVVRQAEALFPKAVRLRQLEALAHRRLKRPEAALLILNTLYEEGHRDPETLGILGAALTQRYKAEKKKILLEKARDRYAEAFQLAPDSYYNGINAASKSALLGELPKSVALAGQVLPLVSNQTNGQDYWATATHAEVRLLRHEYTEATLLYRAAVVAHSDEVGSIESTRVQAADLLDAQGAEEGTKAKLLAAFALD
jgi:tetratricopeptide (TPR) repeat protein